MFGGSLPSFFQNLLPEGALRELVEKEFGAGAFDNFDVLAKLGEDLPGALIARLEAGSPALAARVDKQPATKPAPSEEIRFSLAGAAEILSDKSGCVDNPCEIRRRPSHTQDPISPARISSRSGVDRA
jgi:serine/threonine-protein kinase HipA